MVSFKVDAEATAKVQGSEDERYPIVAKVKGTAKDGSLGVRVSGDDSAPIAAKVIGDLESPLAVKVPEIQGIVETIAKLTEGISVAVSNGGERPISIALGKIPVELTISVYTPSQEQAFKVEIKGSVGEK